MMTVESSLKCNISFVSGDSAVQPVVVAVNADQFLVNRKLIRTHRRHGLQLSLVSPVMNSNIIT